MPAAVPASHHQALVDLVQVDAALGQGTVVHTDRTCTCHVE